MLAAPIFAQQVDIFHAQIRGGGDHGKCTIEVNVDGVAEIEIQGDQGRMRTLSGAASTWRRMECTEPLPLNPLDFHFSGVDGRGRQTLLRDPASNRGISRRPDRGSAGRARRLYVRHRMARAAAFAVMAGLLAMGPATGRVGPRWDDEIRFTGRGDGYFKNFRGPDEVLQDCQVSIDRRGVVTVTFQNARRVRG